MLLMFPSFLMQEKKKISTAHRKRGLFSFSQNWDLNFGARFAKADVCQLTPQYLQSLWAHQILKGCALKMHEVNNSELFLWSFSHWSPLKDPDKRALTQRALARTWIIANTVSSAISLDRFYFSGSTRCYWRRTNWKEGCFFFLFFRWQYLFYYWKNMSNIFHFTSLEEPWPWDHFSVISTSVCICNYTLQVYAYLDITLHCIYPKAPVFLHSSWIHCS